MILNKKFIQRLNYHEDLLKEQQLRIIKLEKQLEVHPHLLNLLSSVIKQTSPENVGEKE